MFNYRILGIIKRELKEKFLSKSFIITTIMFPMLLFVIGGVQAFLVTDEAASKLNIVCEDQNLTQSFQKELAVPESDLMKEGKFSFNFYTMNREELKKHLDDNKKSMLDDKLTGVIFVPDTVFNNKIMEYYSKSPNNLSLSRKLNEPINNVLIGAYFSSKALSANELKFMRGGIEVNGFKISKDENIKEEGFGSIALSWVFGLLLYLSLLMSGQMMLQSVIEEKSSRIAEVILSSVSPREMMTGKIIGSAITALIQMGIWLATVITVASPALNFLPADITVSIKAVQVIFLMVNFAVGLVLFLSLFGMVGSIFDNPQDAQSGMWPVMMLIMIPFFVAMSMMQNPNSPIGNVTALLPFTSIMVMPVKMTIVEVPIWQLALSIVVNIVAIFFVFPIAGKIYRVGILRTGKKPKWSEVVKWLKYKY
ncbi:MAG: hypothetical protein A2499_14815 [Stygiobacter sp. RIFOXYC12_FULL_38_8]|nr:MAG: hypothetical protein A2X62_15600 [Stygiobacter sp. GWC2_38_9]OGU85651.1 MAG: hypothetical protein A2279_01080 [Stygiobacter sp. RIFOXYA12_FULL_38_9]OGV07845.1 MAG: hypothetical protein A2299_06735 [Stygiobacter sp. RIFOXYB2_FULL_37_11]OGV11709.1 MAG: hypothetical protein A2237_18190 [Stygiobacter sp. RIFOXYA2_FULL_38_8]OGV12848.1 MAG: hypothetical protein A2440_16570 [Stygiobacter sp. RIFOXYC2_FULL_38_25]OGV27105.1 MAG: hypothetical protein A2499_14815 [Stygiobacter sp. RIFOXYC12_FULL_